MEIEQINELKTAAIQALVSDDALMERLVLKGGNALDLIYKIAERSSFDLDFSIEDSFDDDNLGVLRDKVRDLLTSTYRDHGYEVFDVTLEKKPTSISRDLDSFWGGYLIEFKLISTDRFRELQDNQDSLRREAIAIGRKGSTKLRIDISRFEHCSSSDFEDVGGFQVKVYSPSLIAIEKLRAICQQMKEYREVVPTATQTSRARDFFDIYTIVTGCGIDLLGDSNKALLSAVFDAKRVPVALLKNIRQYRDFHAVDFAAVRDTVKPTTYLREFDFYFDFVAEICDGLHP